MIEIIVKGVRAEWRKRLQRIRINAVLAGREGVDTRVRVQAFT
jgi:hypothetical protein